MPRNGRLGLISVLAVAIFLPPYGSADARPTYSIKGLGFLPDGISQVQTSYYDSLYSGASSINDTGQVVGGGLVYKAPFPNQVPQGFVWSLDKGLVPLDPFRSDFASYANDINDKGQIAGWSSQAEFGGLDGGRTDFVGSHALVWDSAGRPRNLGTLPGDGEGVANAINDAGAVVGTSYRGEPDFPSHAFVWTEETGAAQLASPPGYAAVQAVDINNAGVIVGNTGAGPISWTLDHDVHPLQQPTDTPSVRAEKITDGGQILGNGGAYSQGYNVYWDQDGKLHDFGDVGPMSLIPSAPDHGPQDLATWVDPGRGWQAPSDGELALFPAAMNASGQIVGTGWHNGSLEAFLMTPGTGPLMVHNDFRMQPNGHFLVEIDGSTEFDVLNVLGVAALQGSLDVMITNPDFAESIQVGDQFDVLTADAITDNFNSLTGFVLGTGYLKGLFKFPPRFSEEVVKSGDKEVLRLTFLGFTPVSSVPLPPALPLLGGALTVLFVTKRKKSNISTSAFKVAELFPSTDSAPTGPSQR